MAMSHEIFPDSADAFDRLVEEALQTQPPAGEAPPELRERLRRIEEYLISAPDLARQPALILHDGNSPVRVVSLGAETRVGRDALCELSLPDDPQMSRQHFAVRAEENFFVLRDGGSRNGTFVNGDAQAIREHVLCDGDLIVAGQCSFLFSDGRRDP